MCTIDFISKGHDLVVSPRGELSSTHAIPSSPILGCRHFTMEIQYLFFLYHMYNDDIHKYSFDIDRCHSVLTSDVSQTIQRWREEVFSTSRDNPVHGQRKVFRWVFGIYAWHCPVRTLTDNGVETVRIRIISRSIWENVSPRPRF